MNEIDDKMYEMATNEMADPISCLILIIIHKR